MESPQTYENIVPCGTEVYENVSCGGCDNHVQFVCEPCNDRFCKACVGEHLHKRDSGSHDVKYHRSFSEKQRKERKGQQKVPVIKCVLDGWQMSGKTSMIKAYIDGKCPNFESIKPTLHDVHSVDFKYQGREVSIHLYDIPSCEFYEGLKRLFLQEHTYDVFLLCIPIDFVNLEKESSNLLKDLHSCIPDPPPIIVIATKIDLRNKTGDERQPKLLTSDELRSFAQTINAVNFLECSAIENESFADVLQAVATIYFTPGKVKKNRHQAVKHCLLM